MNYGTPLNFSQIIAHIEWTPSNKKTESAQQIILWMRSHLQKEIQALSKGCGQRRIREPT